MILAIEAAIAGGSLSLLDAKGREVGAWIGNDGDVARAENLLANTDDLLRSGGLTRKDLSMVCVSAGPGSFTGIRIGMATALGLKNALGIPLSSISALEAIAASTGLDNAVVAVPMGRNSACRQGFSDRRPVRAPDTQEETAFLESLEILTDTTTVLHHALYRKASPRANIVDCGSNVALAVARFATKHPGVATEPLFISKTF